MLYALNFRGRNFVVTALAVLALLPVSSVVGAQTCENLFAAEVRANSSLLASQMADLYARRESGITARGFVSARPGLTGEAMTEAAVKGLSYWALRIYIAKSVGEAEAHWRSVRDPMLRGVYLLDPNAKVDTTKIDASDLKAAEAEGPKIFNALYENAGLIEFAYKDGSQVVHADAAADAARAVVATQLDESFVRNDMTPTMIKLHLEGRNPFLTQGGWTYTKLRGVVLTEDAANSTTYKNMRYLMRKLYREGWRITFNKAFEQSLNQVRDQLRFEEGQWQANSRYRDKELYDATIENFKKGTGFSVEFWDPQGQLAGSIVGEVHGLLYMAESVAYDGVKYPKLTLDLAKIPYIALQERLEAVGIMMIDNGMVSEYTNSLRGKYVDRSEFDRRVQELKARANPVKPDFATPYLPRGMKESELK